MHIAIWLPIGAAIFCVLVAVSIISLKYKKK